MRNYAFLLFLLIAFSGLHQNAAAQGVPLIGDTPAIDTSSIQQGDESDKDISDGEEEEITSYPMYVKLLLGLLPILISFVSVFMIYRICVRRWTTYDERPPSKLRDWLTVLGILLALILWGVILVFIVGYWAAKMIPAIALACLFLLLLVLAWVAFRR